MFVSSRELFRTRKVQNDLTTIIYYYNVFRELTVIRDISKRNNS